MDSAKVMRVACCMLMMAGAARAQDGGRIPSPLDSLGRNLLRSALGWPLALHVAGSAATWWMVREGIDADVQRTASDQDETINTLATAPGMLAGSITPVVLSSSLYFFADDPAIRTSGAASMQAVGIAFLYNNLLKAFTGRVPPRTDDPDVRARSGEFHFGFLEEGVFFGWPSGHTMVNTAMAASLYATNRDRAWALPAAVGYSTLVGTSMVYGQRGSVHWASDAVAGFLMGAGIGWVVGDSYYRALHPTSSGQTSALGAFTLEPLIGEQPGVRLSYVF